MTKTKTCGIYKIISPSGKIYIGQSINIERRFVKYKYLSKTSEQQALTRSFNKHGVENHIFEIIEECLSENLNSRERYWQDYYNVMKFGLNCVLTPADGMRMVVSEEIRKKIGDGNRGKKMLPESRQKISENHARSNMGKPHSKESKINLSNKLKGRKMSEETKLKMKTKRNLQLNDQIMQFDLDLNLIAIFNNMKDLRNTLKETINCSSIAKILRNNKNKKSHYYTSQKFIWLFKQQANEYI